MFTDPPLGENRLPLLGGNGSRFDGVGQSFSGPTGATHTRPVMQSS